MGSAQLQGELWGRHPEVWAHRMEVQMRPVYMTTMAAIRPGPNTRLLDVGCGAGLGLALAAERGAQVSGLDASASLLHVAGRRVPAARLEQGDLETLPYPDGSFDAVTAFNAIQYASAPAKAVAELARVCRAAGIVAIGIWGDPDRCETEGLFQRLRSLAPPPPGAPVPLDCSAPGVVERLMSQAGLHVGPSAEVTVSFEFTDLDDAVTAHTSSGMVQRLIDAVGAEAVSSVIAAVLEADRKPDGSLRQDNVFRYLLATKPPTEGE